MSFGLGRAFGEHRVSDDRRLYWLTAAAGAAAFLLVLASQLYVWVNLWPIRASWGEALLWAVPQLLIWSFLVLGVVELSRRLPLDGARPAVRVAFHIGASVGVSFLGLGVIDLSDRLLHWSTLMGAPSKLVSDLELTIVHLHLGIGVYWVVLGLHHAFRYHRQSRERAVRASRLEAELVQAQLHALRMQLNPHFLFNTLNSIAVLMRRDPVEAERVLHRLSDLLQTTLEQSGRRSVPLSEELRYLESYLEIEQARFGDRLGVTYDVDPGARDTRVPFLVLQPLVENAVRHAVARRDRAVRIEIRAAMVESGLELVVRDDGPGVPDSWSAERDAGVGLTNTRHRLRTLYGTDFRLELGNASGGGFRARIVLPAGPHAEDPGTRSPASASPAAPVGAVGGRAAGAVGEGRGTPSAEAGERGGGAP